MRRPRPTYANVMATIAVFIALGGTSYAVTKLPANSVGSKQIRRGAVTPDKLARGVVVSGARGARGPAGPTGEAGPAGAPGAPGARAPLAAALPVSPNDGDEIYYQSPALAAHGIVWHLRFRAASVSPYRWEFVGGGSLHDLVGARETTTSMAYTTLPTPGPSLAVPLAGDYLVHFGARLNNTAPGGASSMALATNGVVAPGTAVESYQTGDAAHVTHNSAVEIKRSALAANDVLSARYLSVFAGGTGTFESRFIRITPIRVG